MDPVRGRTRRRTERPTVRLRLLSAGTAWILLLMAFVSCSTLPRKNVPAVPTAGADGVEAPEVRISQFRIGSGDEIAITVWRQTDMTMIAKVTPAGTIAYSPVGEVQVSGLTPEELREKLAVLLKEYLVNPRVAVNVTSVISQKVLVLGEVRSPGVFPMDGPMTALEAVARAGGFTVDAETGTILLIRGDFRKPTLMTLDLKSFVDGIAMKDNILLDKGDVLYVPVRPITNVTRFFGHIASILSPVVEAGRAVLLVPEIQDAYGNRNSQRTIVVP